LNTDAQIAWSILNALSDTSFAEELDCYRDDVQEDLGLSDDVMDRLYSYEALLAVLKPKKKPRRTPTKKKKPVVSSDDEDEKIVVQSTEPSAKALRKKLLKNGVSEAKVDALIFDTDTYEKALLLTGDTKPIKDTIKFLGGKWNSSKVGWIFSKRSLLKKKKKVKTPPTSDSSDSE
jgi:hypothetical protein